MMLGILGQIPDSDHPGSVIGQLMSVMASGSYLALSDGVNTSEAFTEAVRHYNENSANTYQPRSPEQITAFFAGLELVAPGVVELSRWRPDATPIHDAGKVPGMCGVGRKPLRSPFLNAAILRFVCSWHG
jgi:S-adenosyl methyltransferase